MAYQFKEIGEKKIGSSVNSVRFKFKKYVKCYYFANDMIKETKIWLLIILINISGCTGDLSQDLTNIAIVGGVGYGLYRLYNISSKSEDVNNYNTTENKNYPSCRESYQDFQGCCSYHHGVLGCYGYEVYCIDGTISPTCTCTVPICVLY